MPSAAIRSLDVRQRPNEAVKPAELIQITGHHELTLNARRAITILWYNAKMQGIEPDKDYHVEIDDLKPDTHKGYEMVEEAITALMRAIIVVKLSDGKTRRVQFLGGNDIDDPDRPAGVLTYSFDKRLISILQDSTIWGRIAIPILMAFTTKYAVSLYENIAQVSGLRNKTYRDYDLEEFRDVLGVAPGRYPRFGELNKHVVKPAAAEINALAPFNVTIMPIKRGKKVSQVRVGWWRKSEDEHRSAWQELNRSKIGRRARISGTVEAVLAPVPSANRLKRRDPVLGLLKSRD